MIWLGLLTLQTVVFVILYHKDFQIRILINKLLTKYQIFTKWPQISHKNKQTKNRNSLSIIGTF